MTGAERTTWLVTLRLTIAQAERAIAGAEQMMQDGLGPLDVETLRVNLWRLRLAERLLMDSATRGADEGVGFSTGASLSSALIGSSPKPRSKHAANEQQTRGREVI